MCCWFLFVLLLFTSLPFEDYNYKRTIFMPFMLKIGNILLLMSELWVVTSHIVLKKVDVTDQIYPSNSQSLNDKCSFKTCPFVVKSININSHWLLLPMTLMSTFLNASSKADWKQHAVHFVHCSPDCHHKEVRVGGKW